ncbi:MAG: Omp28-related outer membrane protein [Bacteroidales bacterium]|jgi:hypothetical protein|nr:Omp28-related outer membrane protein [Bacteroidales bacterium]
MKKSICTVLVVFAIIFNTKAQTFVSTTPQTKNALLEEYTGVSCTWCPDGHRIANELMASFPNNVFAINIHQGSFATPSDKLPDFRTEFGNQLASQAQVVGYPVGTVNRRLFPEYGSVEAIDRTYWAGAINTVLAEPSCVNIAAQSTIDFITRQLTVNVEVYYTANSESSSNMINVALLQNNILGPQTGMSANPTQIIDGLYRHNHMLRHLLTEQWGDEVTTTTAGTFISRQYTYTIPEDLNNVPLILEDLEVVVFIAEGHKVVLTAAKSPVLFLNATPRLGKFSEISTDNCSAAVAVEVKNFWDDQAINSIDLSITSGDNTSDYRWANRTIAPTIVDTIVLPSIDLIPNVENLISVAITAINDQPLSSVAAYTIKKILLDVYDGTKIKVVTDRYGSQVTCELLNANGETVLTAGPWSDLNYNGTSAHTVELLLTESGCYVFNLFDSGGNGINSGTGNGYIDVLNAAGDQIHRFDGKFKDVFGIYLNSRGSADIADNIRAEKIYLSPNPVYDELRIINCELCKGDYVQIFDIGGKIVLNSPISNSINVSSLKTGFYIVKIHCGKDVIVQKTIKL